MVGFTTKEFFPAAALLAVTAFGSCTLGHAQVFVVQREHLGPKEANLTTVQPTTVALDTKPLTERTKQQLIRTFQADEAFAVRPLPLGTKGIMLHANGPLSPSGNRYAEELEKFGVSSKPGDRVVITKFEVRPDRILFEFNDGPEKHHHILQHIEVGGMGGMSPLAQDDGHVPIGSRMVLVFNKFVPEMTASQVRNLIAPMIDFSLKTPVEAFADTLPPKLKGAVLNHEVLVGMNREMVLKAVGQPDQKVREMDGQTPFEEWIYGQPPHEVQFVRFNGNRVIRLEIADVGQPPVIRDKDETDGYFAGQFVHQVRLGDAPPTAPNQEHAPAPAPTLRKPGEQLPDAVNKDQQMKPVQFPDDQKTDQKPKPIPPPPGSAPSQLLDVSQARSVN
ncbi:MAG TPA: hypothetical protein VFE27_17465 [Acidobacteriaceae bacterium]|nr:hypothetical protein [Acidobacteriaceae bacterium]